MARTRRVIRSKKNLIPTLDAEATNSPPRNQPQPPAGEADSPSRGGFKTPPRRDLKMMQHLSSLSAPLLSQPLNLLPSHLKRGRFHQRKIVPAQQRHVHLMVPSFSLP